MATVALKQVLPSPKTAALTAFADEDAPRSAMLTRAEKANKDIPPYGKRQGYIPRVPEDFGDGGAFPEIHVAQYPLNMGKKGASSGIGGGGQIVALTTDQETGDVRYDAIVKQGQRKDLTVYSRNSDMKEKNYNEEDLARPGEDAEEETARRTREMLEKKMNSKIAATQPMIAKETADAKPKYIKYTPAQQNPDHNSGASHRIIRMVEMPQDPMEPPKFKHTKAPKGPGSPPVPVMHSPPRKLTQDERDAWKIPPSISNWKNNKGYIIPLDKRLAADGRSLQEHSVSDTFAKLSEALLIAEQNAREEVEKRMVIQKQLELQQQQAREEELRKVAQQARMQRQNIQEGIAKEETNDERESRLEREKVREDRRREREREHRLENRGSAAKAADKALPSRTHARDISEKIALGEVVPRSQESVYDQRLFNQSAGLDSGFGEDEDYNIFDKRLFGGERERALYKAPGKEEGELYGESQSLESIANTDRFKPHKDFSGVDRSQKTSREGPVQYEREGEKEEDYGLTDFLEATSTAKEGRKVEERKTIGVMHAAGGGASADDLQSGGRSRKVGFSEGQGSPVREPEGGLDRDSVRDHERTERDRRDRDRDPRDRDRDPRDRDRDFRRRSRSPPRRRSRSPPRDRDRSRRSRSPPRRDSFRDSDRGRDRDREREREPRRRSRSTERDDGSPARKRPRY